MCRLCCGISGKKFIKERITARDEASSVEIVSQL